MKRLGNILLSAGTVLALVAGARIPPVIWAVTIGVIVLIAGVILKQIAARRARAEGAATAALPDLIGILEATVSTLADLDSRAAEIEDKHLLSQVDELLKGPIFLFAEGRHALTNSFGTSGYNNVMEHFSRAERYLNRVWSALVDGYGEEARDYLTRSAETFKTAQQKLENLTSKTT
jgi:hypothetical protein